MIENLNDLDADVIFIKNIDNVVPDKLKGDTVLYKKLIAGGLHHIAAAGIRLLPATAGQRQIYARTDSRHPHQFATEEAVLHKESGNAKNLKDDAELVIYLKES